MKNLGMGCGSRAGKMQQHNSGKPVVNADACLKNDPMPNSQLSDNLAKEGWHHHHDHFLDSNPNIRWKETLMHGEKLGLGSREYELIKM